MTENELLEIRTVCKFCWDTFRHLGSHVAQAHGMTAREYKQGLGIYLKIPLTDPSLEELQKKLRRENFDRAAFLATGAATRLKPGHKLLRYVSKQFREQTAARNKIPIERTCRECGEPFVSLPHFPVCEKCLAKRRELVRIRAAANTQRWRDKREAVARGEVPDETCRGCGKPFVCVRGISRCDKCREERRERARIRAAERARACAAKRKASVAN